MVNANATAAKMKVRGSKDSVGEQDPMNTTDSSVKDDNRKKKKKKKTRSDISVSTASDLDQIVTHSKNLFIKYNAIANAHNQRISWAMISKELGMHNKVREKYARMHSRALQNGFDFTTNGKHLKFQFIKLDNKEWNLCNAFSNLKPHDRSLYDQGSS